MPRPDPPKNCIIEIPRSNDFLGEIILSALFHYGQIPCTKLDLQAVSRCFTVPQIGPNSISITEHERFSPKVEVVVHALAHAVDAMLHMEARWKLLIGTRKPGLVDSTLEHRRLQFIGKIRSLLQQRAGAELIFRDGRPFSEEGMVVVRNGFRVFGHQELRPELDLVGIAHMKWIVLEIQRMFEV